MTYEIWINGKFVEGFDSLKEAKKEVDKVQSKMPAHKEIEYPEKDDMEIGATLYSSELINQIWILKGNKK